MTDPLLFVSHVSEDHPAAMELVNEFERRGVLCWIAPRDVRPGEPFDDEIDGRGVERNLQKAVAWYRKAAKQG